jgi:Leucine-rich repeat (LRR) protein
MKLIFAQKPKNLSQSLAVTCIVIGLASCINKSAVLVSAATPGNSGLIFANSWCRKKDLLTPEAKHTVELVLKKLGTTDCDTADRELSTLKKFALYGDNITDINPIASLTNLTELKLNNSQISDLKPLQSLTNLTYLDVSHTPLSDLKPLASLTNLTELKLNNTQISEIKPLASLTNLTELDLSENKISDIKPLESLTNLAYLRLSHNPISSKICHPVQLVDENAFPPLNFD